MDRQWLCLVVQVRLEELSGHQSANCGLSLCTCSSLRQGRSRLGSGLLQVGGFQWIIWGQSSSWWSLIQVDLGSGSILVLTNLVTWTYHLTYLGLNFRIYKGKLRRPMPQCLGDNKSKFIGRCWSVTGAQRTHPALPSENVYSRKLPENNIWSRIFKL